MLNNNHGKCKSDKMKSFNTIFLVLVGLVALSACETAQEQLGLTKEAPDEFKVVKRAPLEMPPNYTLRPPSPGTARPQEQETAEEARETVLGNASAQNTYTPSGSEAALLQAAGATQTDPAIRRKVDEETANMRDENEPVIEKIMSIGRDRPPPAKVVDAAKEAQRLQKNQAEGKPVTSGETPSVE